MLVGLSVCVISLLLNFLFLGKPKTVVSTQEAAGQAAAQEESTGYSLKEARRTASFWMFGVAMFLGAMLFTGVGLFGIDYFMTHDIRYENATTYMAVATFAGALIVMFGGVITQKLGGRGLLFMMFGGFAIGVVLLTFVFPIGLSALIGFSAMVLVACVRPLNTVPGLVLPEMFGRKDFSSLNNFALSFYALGAGLSSILIGVLADATGNNYTLAFTILAVAAVVSLVLFLCALAMSPMKKQGMEE